MLSRVAAVTGECMWEGFEWKCQLSGSSRGGGGRPSQSKIGHSWQRQPCLVRRCPKWFLPSHQDLRWTWRCWAAFIQPDPSVHPGWVDGTPRKHVAHYSSPRMGQAQAKHGFLLQNSPRVLNSWYLELQLLITFHDSLTMSLFLVFFSYLQRRKIWFKKR